MIKEIKTHPRLSELEYASKIGDIISLLKKSAEVRVIVRFKGKELGHPELGVKLLSRFVEDLQDYATAPWPPLDEGRQMPLLFTSKIVG